MSDKDLERQEWDAGLPAPEELMPLTQTLIPRDLALAFNINLAPTDLAQFSNSTEDMLATRCLQPQASPSTRQNLACLSTRMLHNPMIQVLSETAGLPPISFVDHGLPTKALKLDGSLWGSPGTDQQQKVANLDCGNAHSAGFMCLDTRVDNGLTLGAESSEGGSSKQLRKRADTEVEDIDSSLVGTENSNEDSTTVPRTLKRSRLVWTPQLHKRFVEAVAQLGLKHAVPKTIMQLMNVDGLTRENVASHLQKYRLYLKRMQGVSSEGPPMQDNLFAPSSLPLGLAGSPQFLPNRREDIIPFLMPMAIGSLGVGQIAERLSFPLLPNTDLSYNNGYPQPFPCQRMSQVHLYDGRTRQGSPQRQALTLFPQNGT